MQLCVSDTMDPRALDPRVIWAFFYEVLPPSPGSLWSAVMPRPPRPSSHQSVLFSDVIQMDEGCWIATALQKHALALHQMMLMQGIADASDLRCLESLTSPSERSGTCPSSSSLACMSALTFIDNLKLVNAAVSLGCNPDGHTMESVYCLIVVEMSLVLHKFGLCWIRPHLDFSPFSIISIETQHVFGHLSLLHYG